MSTPLRVLCIDPGETTGWATIQATGDDLVLLRWGQTQTWHDWSSYLVPELTDTVVLERFSLYRSHAAEKIGDEFVTVQVIGVARYLAEQAGIPVVVQPASLIHYRAGQVNPALMREIAPLLPDGGWEWRHCRDAIAHGVYALRHGALRSTLREHTNARRSRSTPTRTDPASVPACGCG